MLLQARYKAEEVWYSVVGEKEKELPNVIDYNIKPEITKDASSVVNANNDTTTGMADVIPWINAPKLLESTSVICDKKNAWNVVWIEDYLDKDEWQPVVDRVLSWEFVCVRCIFKAYALLTEYFFIPVSHTSSLLRFQCIAVTQQYMRISCHLSNWTITSITTSNWSA